MTNEHVLLFREKHVACKHTKDEEGCIITQCYGAVLFYYTKSAIDMMIKDLG